MSKEAIEGNFKVQFLRGNCSVDEGRKLKIKIDNSGEVTITTTFTTEGYDEAWSEAKELTFNNNSDPYQVTVTGKLNQTVSRSFTIKRRTGDSNKKLVNCLIHSSHGARSAGAMASDDDGAEWNGEDE